ncbi:MAG: hypothetical protein BGN86_10020 [Caulobacterales bacterium 68-7]|nr:MAG: hypothetical protein BGN86_10020 [Caulobacterales bacterium 68-7]
MRNEPASRRTSAAGAAGDAADAAPPRCATTIPIAVAAQSQVFLIPISIPTALRAADVADTDRSATEARHARRRSTLPGAKDL